MYYSSASTSNNKFLMHCYFLFGVLVQQLLLIAVWVQRNNSFDR